MVDCANYLCVNGEESHNYFSFQLTHASAWSVVGAGKILQKEGVSLLGSGVSSHQAPEAFEVSLGFMAAARGASQASGSAVVGAPAMWVTSSAPGSYSTW